MKFLPGDTLRCKKSGEEYEFLGYDYCQHQGRAGISYCTKECLGQLKVKHKDLVYSTCFHYTDSGLSVEKVEIKNEWDQYNSAKTRRGICLRK